MPEGETEVTTPPEAVNSAETEVVSKGIQDRLTRFENKITKERIEPLEQRLASIRATVEEQGLDIAIFGFEPDPSKQQVATPAVVNTTSTEAVKLMRLEEAYKAGLRPEVLPLITGTDEESIRQQVELIKGMDTNPSRRRTSPIQPGPDGKPLPTFKRSQIRNTQFFLDNQVEIMKATKEGRLINDL